MNMERSRTRAYLCLAVVEASVFFCMCIHVPGVHCVHFASTIA